MFTEVQKLKILRYIGWNVRQIDSDSRYYSNIIANRLEVPEHVELEAVGLLNRIISIDVELEGAPKRLKVTSIEGVRLNEYEIPLLRKERDKVIYELSVLLVIYPPRYYGIKYG